MSIRESVFSGDFQRSGGGGMSIESFERKNQSMLRFEEIEWKLVERSSREEIKKAQRMLGEKKTPPKWG